jgi:hypothetical protein
MPTKIQIRYPVTEINLMRLFLSLFVAREVIRNVFIIKKKDMSRYILHTSTDINCHVLKLIFYLIFSVYVFY